MCSRSSYIIKINYSTFFSNLFWKFITTIYSSKMFNTKSFYPIIKIKVGKRFNYKMLPRMGIELNGLFFPRSSPEPLDLDFFFLTPIPIGFSQVPKKGGD